MDRDAVNRSADVIAEQTLILDKPPCCLEFWPLDPEYFVVGTYNLVVNESGDSNSNSVSNGWEDSSRQSLDTANTNMPRSLESSSTGMQEQRRDGSLVLMRLNGNIIEEVENTQTASAVLDVHFSPHDPSILAAATSNGTVILYNLEAHLGPWPPAGAHLSHPVVLSLFEDDVVVTSVAWDPEDENRLAVTTSNGDVVLVSLSPLFYDLQSGRKSTSEYDPTVKMPHQELDLQIVYRHSLEAWTVSWNPAIDPIDSTGFGVLSGGDDAILRYTPVERLMPTLSGAGRSKQSFPTGAAATMPWLDKRTHDAGVTAILPLTMKIPVPKQTDDVAAGEAPSMSTIHEEEEEETLSVILTGSYDDHLRIISCPFHSKSAFKNGTISPSLQTTSGTSAPRATGGNGSHNTPRKSVTFASSTSAFDKPQVLHEMAMPGGVWRFKVLSTNTEVQDHSGKQHRRSGEHGSPSYDPHQPLNNNPVHPLLRNLSPSDVISTVTIKVTLAVACMYAGAYVVELQLVRSFREVINSSFNTPSPVQSVARSRAARRSLDTGTPLQSIDEVVSHRSPSGSPGPRSSSETNTSVHREDQWRGSIVASMTEHTSICYGIDAQPLPSLSTASFSGLNLNGNNNYRTPLGYNQASPRVSSEATRHWSNETYYRDELSSPSMSTTGSTYVTANATPTRRDSPLTRVIGDTLATAAVEAEKARSSPHSYTSSSTTPSARGRSSYDAVGSNTRNLSRNFSPDSSPLGSYPHSSPISSSSSPQQQVIKRKRLKRRILSCSFYDRRVCLWRY